MASNFSQQERTEFKWLLALVIFAAIGVYELIKNYVIPYLF